MDFLSRRTVRNYTKEKISEDIIKEILKVGLTAPTGKNTKAVELILIKDKEILKKISEAKKPIQSMPVESDFSILVVGDKERTDTWIENCSIALTLMQLKAWEYEVGSCWIQLRERFSFQGESSEKIVKSLLNIPENYGILALMTFGKFDQEVKGYTEKDIDFNRVHIEKF
nr:nitroreductase family protein [uncultured Cetobacterium sp.]